MLSDNENIKIIIVDILEEKLISFTINLTTVRIITKKNFIRIIVKDCVPTKTSLQIHEHPVLRKLLLTIKELTRLESYLIESLRRML
jgi:hypothetical protein